MVRYSYYHMPVGLYNIVIEHGVGTHRFRSTLCSGLDLVSFPLGRTSVLGLELGTRLWFVGWITDEIVPLSRTLLPSGRGWLLRWLLWRRHLELNDELSELAFQGGWGLISELQTCKTTLKSLISGLTSSRLCQCLFVIFVERETKE